MKFLRLAFSEKGTPSSKRIMGGMLILVFIGCIITLAIKDGGTDEVCDLLATSLYCAVTLLGISSVTNVFKKGE